MADGDADVAVVAGADPVVIAKEGRADTFVATAQQVVGDQALVDRLEAAGLSPAQVDDALSQSSARVVRLERGGVEPARLGRSSSRSRSTCCC